MRALLKPIKIAGLVLVALLLLGAESGSGGTELQAPLTDTCTGAGDPWTCPLTVTVNGNGSVSSNDQQIISCRASSGDCTGAYSFFDPETAPFVSLTAVPDSGWNFVDWSGAGCEGSGTTCRIQMAHAQAVTAVFQQATYTLTVTVAGGGTGTVTGSGISCPGDCTQTYNAGTGVQLTATPTGGSTFAGWGGDCAGTANTCTVTMSANRNVSATFNAPAPVRRTLTVSVSGTGKVTGPGIDCPTDCSEQYDNGTSVQLTAAPGTGMTTSWGGDCSGTTTTCSLTMSADRNVTVTFAATPPVQRTLNVTVSGNGKVTGVGIDCPSDCTQQYDSGTTVQLTAAPGAGLTTTWGGACSGTGTTCSVAMTADRTVSATFAASGGGTPTRTLTVTVSGSGSGTVTGSGISCPGDCTQDYPSGTNVTLTATPSGSASRTWGGACAAAGSGATCTVAMTEARTVSVTFTAAAVPAAVVPDIGVGEKDSLPPRLPAAVEQVIVKIDGTGKVTSTLGDRVVAGAPGGAKPINCGTTGSGPPRFDCFGEYRPGQALTLKAQPAGGYAFKGWTGACAGSGATCRVSLRDSRTTTAIFEQGGTGSAVAALLRPPNLRVRWQSSTGAGNLVLRGSTSLPANARVDMRRPGGGPLATLKLKLGGGSFRETLALRKGALRGGAKLFPGGFTVALTGRAGRLKLPLQMQTISIPAPAEGVVRRAFKSRTQNGKSVTRFPAGTKQAWANFRFETQPLRNQKVYVRWYFPGGRVVGQVERSNRPVISSYLALETGLPSGLWIAELRTGKRVIQRLSVRVG